jgi:SNF2 family DNA or RNA helicase
MAATTRKVFSGLRPWILEQNEINGNRHIRATDIRSFLYHGPDRQNLANGMEEFDVVLTTYDTLRSDWKVHGPLYNFNWARVILDEG